MMRLDDLLDLKKLGNPGKALTAMDIRSAVQTIDCSLNNGFSSRVAEKLRRIEHAEAFVAKQVHPLYKQLHELIKLRKKQEGQAASFVHTAKTEPRIQKPNGKISELRLTVKRKTTPRQGRGATL